MKIQINARTKFLSSLLAVLLPLSLLSAQPALATTTGPVADVVGSNTEAYLNGQTLREGATLADGTVVRVGTSALLTPGVGDREIHTTYTSTTVYQAGSAEAPEGWTLYFSTDNGATWQLNEPAPASSVTDIKAVAASVTAGLISGYSQAYSTETTAAIPASTFSANSGGDGWGVTLMDNYVFNVYHHDSRVGLDCHLKSDSSSCYSDGQPRWIQTSDGVDYFTGSKSNPVADSLNGKLYLATAPASGPNEFKAGVLCIDVTDVANPIDCGFTVLSDEQNVFNWIGVPELNRVGSKYYFSEPSHTRILCFDSSINAACAENLAPEYGNNDYFSRMLAHGSSIYLSNSAGISCYKLSDLSQCSGSNWPRAIGGDGQFYFLLHESVSGVVDGMCRNDVCIDFDGNVLNVNNPLVAVSAINDLWNDGVVVNHRMYVVDASASQVGCFDFAADDVCAGFDSSAYNNYNTVHLYQVTSDPENATCLWFNSDQGVLGNFDGITGQPGCAANPVITLQPSQFAPRYACSSINGITAWRTLRISNIVGGGTATGIFLTVRKASGEAVTGWTNVPVTVGSDLDMSALDTALSGSRPTFSFAFMGVSGSITSATIALDYQGKGPELCSSVALTSGGGSLPLATQVTGTLVDAVASQSFDSVRNLNIDAQDGQVLFLGVPGAPLNLNGSGLNTSANLTFTPPTDVGGAPITGYLYSIDGGSSWLTPAQVNDNGDGTLSIPLSGLTAGQLYSMQVLAENTIGRGTPASLSIFVQLVEPTDIQDTKVDQGPIYLATTNQGSGLPYTYTVSPSNVCTVTGTVITLVGQGLCSITADQPGDDTHIAATASSSFTVLPADPPKTVPGEVVNLEASGEAGQISIQWQVPLSDGNSAITDYVIQYKVGSSYVPFVDGVSTATNAVITGLVNGTVYLVRVAAKNAIGQGAFAAPVSATPATVPGQPTNLSVSISGTDANLTWQAPVSDGGAAVNDYNVYYKVRTSPTWIAFTDGLTPTPGATVSGLDGVSDYDFLVEATNIRGAGVGVSTVDVATTPGDQSVALTWVAPLVGSPVNYVVRYREVGTVTWSEIDTQSTSLSGTVTGLNNGTEYEFEIAAMADSVTVQSYSSRIAATPLGSPTAPTVTTVAGVSQVTVSWSGATGNGAAITDYVLRYRANGSNVWRTVNDGFGINSTYTVVGLVNGTVYDFQVAAVSSVATGAYSSTVTGVPRRAPLAPAITATVTTQTTVVVTWTDPSDNGGAAIDGYVIQFKERSAVVWSTYAGSEFTGSSVIIRNLTAYTSYSFKVAATNEAGTGTYSAASADTTLGYTISFLRAGADGGSAPSSTSGGGRFLLPNNGTLTRTGFSFGGWVLNGTTYASGQYVTVSKNTNLFARWIRCYMTYVAPTKTSGQLPPTVNGCVNRIVRANVGSLKRTGYYFSGWSINGTTYRPGDTISVEGQVTAIALWSRFTITYMAARATGGLAPSSIQGYGSTTLSVSEGTLVRDGYTFAGWVLGGVSYAPGDAFMLKGNVKAFAKWTRNSNANLR